MIDAEQESQWERERRESLDRWIEGRAQAIAALPLAFDRMMALQQFERGKPTRIRERLEQRVRELWEARRR